jgi:hypothetical protein
MLQISSLDERRFDLWQLVFFNDAVHSNPMSGRKDSLLEQTADLPRFATQALGDIAQRNEVRKHFRHFSTSGS